MLTRKKRIFPVTQKRKIW